MEVLRQRGTYQNAQSTAMERDDPTLGLCCVFLLKLALESGWTHIRGVAGPPGGSSLIYARTDDAWKNYE